jgi:thiamine-phosphate pyrophosphorylase
VGGVLRIPKLMLVTDRRSSRLSLPELAVLALANGVDLVQIREKDLNETELRALTVAIVEATGDPARISVNGNLGIAGELGVGLHLPEAGLEPAVAREMLGPSALIGRSVHSPESARNSQGSDYLIAGHVFATASKADRQPIGPDGLRRIVEAAPCPVLAIGDISAANVQSVLAAGAYGVAVISAINGAADPAEATRVIARQFS